MKFYKLLIDSEDNPNNKKFHSTNITIDESSLGFNRYDTDSGNPLINWSENIVAKYEFNKNYPVADYITTNLGWFLISSKFKDLLVEMDIKGLEFYPLILKCTNQVDMELLTFLANILVVIDFNVAVDLKRSKYFYYELNNGKRLISFTNHCLKSSAINKYDIFRLSDNTFPIFISEKVKKAIEDHGITGCDFLEIEITNDLTS